jgi:hypothetical protein
MSKNSISEKHWSFIHNFKQARWIVNSDLALRIPIMLIFLLWFIMGIIGICGIKNPLNIIEFLALVINFIAIPFHTLLICKSEMDRMYLMHLVGFPLNLACHAIQEYVRFLTFENERFHHINAAFGYALLSICFLIWSVPTRILYFRTFHIARKTLGTDANSLVWQLIVPLITLTVFGVLSIIILMFTLPSLENYGRFVPVQVESFLSGFWTLFEIYMYSKIDPLRRGGSFCSNYIEKIYIAAGLLLLFTPAPMIISMILSKKDIFHWVYYAQDVLVRIILAGRFIILWYYCVNELKRYEIPPNDAETDTPRKQNTYQDIVDLSSLTIEEIKQMELL